MTRNLELLFRRMPAREGEVFLCVVKPVLQIVFYLGPVASRHGKPSGIPVTAIDDHVLAEDTLKVKAEP